MSIITEGKKMRGSEHKNCSYKSFSDPIIHLGIFWKSVRQLIFGGMIRNRL